MGKKEKKNKPQRNEKNKHKFPEPLLKKLEEAGLDTKNLIFCCTGDMDNDACYRSAWLSFDKKGLYVAYGTEKLVKAKHKKHVEPSYTVEEITAISEDPFTGGTFKPEDGIFVPASTYAAYGAQR